MLRCNWLWLINIIKMEEIWTNLGFVAYFLAFNIQQWRSLMKFGKKGSYFGRIVNNNHFRRCKWRTPQNRLCETDVSHNGRTPQNRLCETDVSHNGGKLCKSSVSYNRGGFINPKGIPLNGFGFFFPTPLPLRPKKNHESYRCRRRSSWRNLCW